MDFGSVTEAGIIISTSILDNPKRNVLNFQWQHNNYKMGQIQNHHEIDRNLKQIINLLLLLRLSLLSFFESLL
jgi:hypothetical protein